MYIEKSKPLSLVFWALAALVTALLMFGVMIVSMEFFGANTIVFVIATTPFMVPMYFVGMLYLRASNRFFGARFDEHDRYHDWLIEKLSNEAIEKP